MEMYLIDSMMYSRTETNIDSIRPAEWIKIEMPRDYYSMVGMGAYVRILKVSEIEFLPDEEVNGIECYVVRLTPDLKEFREVIIDQMKVFRVYMFGTEVRIRDIEASEKLSQMFRNLDIIYWIAKDTFYLIKERINMTMVLNPEITSENFEMRMDLEITNTYHSHNEPVTVELSEEAKGASLLEKMFEFERLKGTVEQVNPAEKTILLNTPEGNEVIVQVTDDIDIFSATTSEPVTFESIKPGQQIIVIKPVQE